MTFKNIDQEETATFIVKKIYDPFLRFLHCWIGLSVFSLLLTIWLKSFIKPFPNGSNILYRMHFYIGLALMAGICLRVLWGFIGPTHARFKNMFYFHDWIRILKTRKYDTSLHWGHDRYASLAYFFFYLLMIYQSFSGFVLAAKKFGIGPFSSFGFFSKEKSTFIHFLKEIHEIIFYISMIYIVIHIGMIMIHEIKGKYPIAQAMFNGFQYRKKKEK